MEECRQALERQGPGDAGPADAAPAPRAAPSPEPVPAEAYAASGDEQANIVEPRRPVYRRWWFWTILGVVVAGAVTAGTVVGVAAQEPETVLPSGSAGTVDWR